MIRVKSLSKSFGGRQVLENLSCEFPAGSVSGLVGRNGSGKSTLLNCISCRLRPNHGRIEFRGREIAYEAAWHRARRGIVATFQEPRLSTELSLVDLLKIAAKIDGHEAASVALANTIALLGDRLVHEPLAFMSFGERKIANLCAALAMKPRALLLDEPVSGLSFASTESIGKIVRELATAGITTVIVEHNFDFLRGCCDSIFLVDAGCIALRGTPEEVFDNEKLVRAFQ